MSEEKPSFWADLKRRHVYRTAAWYTAAVFAIWQVVDLVTPALGLPAWIMKAVVILSAIGFFPALVLSWVYDLKPASAVRSARLGFATLAVVLFGMAGWWVTGRIKPVAPALSEVSLAVFPFSVVGGGLPYLGDGLVDLLSRNLTGATDLQPLDPSLMKKVTQGKPTDAATAGSIARQVGAGRFVVGSVSGVGGQVRIDATLYRLRDSAVAVTTETVRGDTIELFRLVDQLTAALLARLTEGAATKAMVETAANTTTSLPALKAYLQGEQAYRAGRHPAAIAAFQNAIALDSTFVLAQYRMAVAYQMNEQYWLARSAIMRVLPHKDRLLPHDLRAVDAFAAMQDGRIAEAVQSYEAIINEYPHDLESRVHLSFLIVLYNLHRAETQQRALELLESVLEADPGFKCIACQMAELANVLGQHDRAEHLYGVVRANRGRDSGTLHPVVATSLALHRGDTARARTLLASFDEYSDPAAYDNWLMNPGGGSIGLGHLEFTDAILALPKFGQAVPVNRSALSGMLHSARGEWKLAHDEVRKTLQISMPDDMIMHAYRAVARTPFEAPLPAATEVREVMARFLPDTSAVPINELARAERGIRIFMLGLAASRSRDAAATLAYADSLKALVARDPLNAGCTDNARLVLLADHALRANKPADALRQLEAISLELRPGQLRSWLEMMQYAGMLRVRAYIALARNDDALQWLRYHTHYFGMAIPAENYGIYERDMADVLDQLGQRTEAVRHYAAFVKVWQNADPELQPQVAAARRRLTELTSR